VSFLNTFDAFFEAGGEVFIIGFYAGIFVDKTECISDLNSKSKEAAENIGSIKPMRSYRLVPV
jgi:hypothetical protein